MFAGRLLFGNEHGEVGTRGDDWGLNGEHGEERATGREWDDGEGEEREKVPCVEGLMQGHL